MQFGIRYDLRNPPAWRKPWDKFYGHFIDQVAWADQHGFARVGLSEHHFAEDGYLPSLATAAAAIAARTKKIKIALNLILLPLKHPVQVAEDVAILDIISGGRIEVAVGAGYRRAEYDGYGIPISQRPSRMEEAITILRRCWEEDEFSFEGRYWKLKNVRVMPRPVQKPRPKITMGGSSAAAARRAAHVADAFAPTNPALMKDWRDEMIKLGKDPGPEPRPAQPNAPRPPANFLHVSRKPNEAWKIIGPHAMWESNSYAVWTRDRGGANSPYKPATDPEQLRASYSYAVMTPEETVSLGQHMEQANPGGATLTFHPMMGGMPLELGQEGLELVASEVMPKLGSRD